MGKFFYNLLAAAVLAAAVLAAAALMPVPLSGAEAALRGDSGTDEEGHVLVPLWKEFRQAENDDRPDREAELLEKIISQARRRHLPWDFYDGWQRYIDVSVSKDWKRHAALDSAMNRAVEDFGEPVVTYTVKFRYAAGLEPEVREFLEKNGGRLKNERNPQFYGTGYNTMWSSYYCELPEAIIDNISNDYEYVLWSLFLRSRGRDAGAGEMLSGYLGSSYPNGAYMEFYKAGIGSGGERKAALEAFAEKYSGRAVSCYAIQELMSDRFSRMQADRTLSSDDYRSFREECGEFEKARKRFSGTEKAVAEDCGKVAGIIRSLDSESIRIVSMDDTVCVLLRNIDRCHVELFRDGGVSPLFTSDLENSAGSYFLYDTLRVDLPALDDGLYILRGASGKEKAEASYRQNSLSAAWRMSRDGISVYATDMKSGKPLGSADVDVFRGDSLVASFRSIDFSRGFVPLAVKFNTGPKDSHGYRMVCSYREAGGRLRCSKDIPIGSSRPYYPAAFQDNVSASIFKDRSVYSPGDTVRFKAVLFRVSDAGTRYSALPEGGAVKVLLSGPRGEKVDSASFRTNSFGSVAGAFHLPEGNINGRYTLLVSCPGGQGASSSFIVGDIEIPTYDLEFDSSDTLYFPGDTVTVGGTVSSYTGHSLSAASVGWKVFKWGETVDEGTVELDSDGHFSFSFTDKPDWGQGMPYSYYNIEVRVSDATGETLEFSKGVTVTPRFDLSAELVNPSEGIVTPLPQRREYRPMSGYGTAIMDGDTARVRFVARNADYREITCVPVRYSVYSGETLVTEGNASPGDIVDVDLSGMASGLYRIEAEASASLELPEGKDSILVGRYIYELIKISGTDTALDADVENLFRVVDDEDIVLQMATGNGPLWAVVEIWGSDALAPLHTEMVYLEGKRGEPGSAVTLRYGYEDVYPDDVRLTVFYFRNGSDYRYSADYHRKNDEMLLPLDFVSFTDSTSTGTQVTMTVRAAPGAECVVAVFDKGTEQIMPNIWGRVSRTAVLPYVPVYAHGGSVGCEEIYVRGSNNSFMAKLAPAASRADAVVEESVVQTSYAGTSDAMAYDTGQMHIRSVFSNTLAFIPFLDTGADSTASFTFMTSDKVSTYNVNVFAHDRGMRNGVARAEMLVTKPVMVSVSAPQFLHEGDRYTLDAAVSNSTGEEVSGMLDLYVYGSADYAGTSPELVESRPVTVLPGGTSKEEFMMAVPSGRDVLGFRLVFCALPETGQPEDGRWSDGIFFTVPVEPDFQVLAEAHSAVLLPGMDRDSLKTALSGMFVNTLPYGAESKEISLLDMVKSSIPEKCAVTGNDVVSVSDALFVRMLTGCIYGRKEVDALVEDILACQNADGGFGWFSGMKSSGQITALLLERVAELRSRTHVKVIDDGSVEKALAYLDRGMLSGYSDSARVSVPGISLAQYLYVRTMYPSVPLLQGSYDSYGKKALSAFRKDVKEFLTLPTGSERFDGRLIDKARRISSAMSLLSGDGAALAGGLGLKGSSLRKVSRTMADDAASLCSYAVGHASGGMYYPNAVLPWRGLIDSELYAHSLICDVLQDYSCSGTGEYASQSSRIADGVRLWMMIQKETQQWDADPAYVRAMASVLDGSQEVLSTVIVVMSKRYEKPYEGIKASGNGLSVSRGFFRADGSGAKDLVSLSPGDTVSVGDKIVCRYTVKSAENRSFVKLSVPRSASMRPVDQVSGMSGWWRSGPGFLPAMSHYRNVMTDRTEYYFDVLPEETTVIEEEFFVTRAGVYSSPVMEAECVYAPHYRANDAFMPPVHVDGL